jgi:hypothetical protein
VHPDSPRFDSARPHVVRGTPRPLAQWPS